MKTLLLIDANALIHRSFHALPPLTTPDNKPIGAIYGLSSTLLKILKEQSPDYIAAAFDRPEPTFRKELFEDYKAHRPPTADELISQIIKAHELFKKFNISTFEQPGYEADDIIGTLVKKFSDPDLKIVILTGDLDTLQLVSNKKVVVQTFKKGISGIGIYDEERVFERYGLRPSQLQDYKSLVGDPSDNIPGLPGIGPKTATKLLTQYKTLTNLYKKMKKDDPLSHKILPYQDKVFFYKQLVTIKLDVPLEVELSVIKYNGLPKEQIIKYFTELGFQRLIQQLL